MAVSNKVCLVDLDGILEAECYHGWSERVLEPKECKSDEDCAQTNGASCIFSLTANARVCCGLKPGAILPGKTLLY